MDYVNPFGMLPQPQDFNSTNLLSVANAQQRMDMSMPFIDMARQRMGTSNQLEQFKAQEYMSPTMTGERMLDAQNKTGKYTQEMAERPSRQAYNIAKAKADLETLPFMTQEVIAKAEDSVRKYQNTPVMELINLAGSTYEGLQKVPAPMRPAVYAQALERWQMMNPGRQIPAQLKEYNEQNLAMLRYAQVVDAEQAGKERIKRIEGDEAYKREELKARTDREVAGIGAGATVESARIRSQNEKQQTGPQRLNELRRRIATKPDDQEARDEYQLTLESEFTKSTKDNPLLEAAGIKVLTGGPEALKKYEDLYENERRKFMERHRVTPPPKNDRVKITKDGGKTFSTVPRSQLEQAKTQGWKEAD